MSREKNIISFPTEIPESKEAFLELLRMHLDIAHKENLVYLEIQYRTDKMDKASSVSITTPST